MFLKEGPLNPSGGATLSFGASQNFVAKARLPWQSVSRLFVFFFVILGIFRSAPTASAKDIYISQSGTGSGTSCADTLPASSFNNPANWGSGSTQIGPGTTVHLCGTFAGTAGQTMLTFQGSGTSGNPITLLFEPGANLTAPYWSTSGAINTNGDSWLVVNGDIANGRQGIIQNTANGTGLANQQSSTGIYALSCANCTVKNLTIANLYVRTSAGDTSGGSVIGIYYNPNSTNLTVLNVLAHDVRWAIFGAAEGLTVLNSEFYNVDHGVTLGNSSGIVISNFTIHDNHFHDYANWDTTSNSFHHDGIHVWANFTGSQVNGGSIYNNLFDGDVGNNVTGHVYLESVVSNPAGVHVSNVKVYNNVFLPPAVLRGGYRDIWFCGDGGDPSGNAAYNNFINTGAQGQNFIANNQKSVTFENNIVENSGFSDNEMDMASGSTAATIDYNTYMINPAGGNGNTFSWNGSFTDSLATWRSLCGCDAHSQLVTSAQINNTSDGHLQSGSVAIGAGANLTSLGITTLDSDKSGGARPPSGPWDAGAYTFATRPAPPSGLTVIVN